MTDPEAILAAAKAGDPAALSKLVQVHRHGVYRYGLQVCRTTEDAEDALQETLWAATRAIRTFQGSASSIVSWLFTIVRRECFRLLDGRRGAPAALGDLGRHAAVEEASSLDALHLRRRSEQLAAALEQLDPIHREVVLLRDLQELSAPEAAARIGISVEALKSRLHRARVQLRDHVLSRAHDF